jgi:hypothetical protein
VLRGSVGLNRGRPRFHGYVIDCILNLKNFRSLQFSTVGLDTFLRVVAYINSRHLIIRITGPDVLSWRSVSCPESSGSNMPVSSIRSVPLPRGGDGNRRLVLKSYCDVLNTVYEVLAGVKCERNSRESRTPGNVFRDCRNAPAIREVQKSVHVHQWGTLACAKGCLIQSTIPTRPRKSDHSMAEADMGSQWIFRGRDQVARIKEFNLTNRASHAFHLQNLNA